MDYGTGSYGGSGRSLPPEVYRRRRLTVIVALGVVVGVVTWALSGGGGGSATGGQPPDPKPAAAPRPTDTSSPKAEPTVTVTVTSTPKVTTTVTATPKGMGKPCRDVRMRLVVRTDADAYGGEKKPTFTVRVKPKRRCLLDTDKLGLVVTSGTDRIWSTRDCPGRQRWPRQITPRKPYVSDVTWDKVRSNPATCDKKSESAAAGWYAVTAKLGGETSNEAVFRLK